MEPVIRSLTLKRFRSIPEETIEFDNPTFLVGVNGSGKSNLVDAFAFLAEAMAAPLQAVFDKRGGIATVRTRTFSRSRPPKFELYVTFGSLNGAVSGGLYGFEITPLPNFAFEVTREQCVVLSHEGGHWFDRKGRTFQSSITDKLGNRLRDNKSLRPALETTSLALPVVGGDSRFAPILRTLASMRVYALEPAKLREMQDPDSGVSLRTDGSNAASVLQEIERHHPEDIERIGEILAAIVPHTSQVRALKHGNKLSLEFTQEWGANKRLKFESFNMSDGTLRVLGLLTAVYQQPAPTLMVIEEPEATIHPGALGAVLDLLRYASTKMQIIVTTHSPELLDAKWIEDRHLRIVIWDEGATGVARVSEPARLALQRHLMGAGELLRSNALDPEPLHREKLAHPSALEPIETSS